MSNKMISCSSCRFCEYVKEHTDIFENKKLIKKVHNTIKKNPNENINYEELDLSCYNIINMEGKQYREFDRNSIGLGSGSMTGGVSVDTSTTPSTSLEDINKSFQSVNAFSNNKPKVPVDNSIQAAIDARAKEMLEEQEASNPFLSGSFGNGFTNIFESLGTYTRK